MTFSEAFAAIRDNPEKGMRLPHWSPEVVIRSQHPNEGSEMTHPYLYADSRYGKVPWRETFPELFALNWEVVDI
jgi:hypothetical protein